MLIFEIFYFSIKKELQLKKRNNLMNRMKGKKSSLELLIFYFLQLLGSHKYYFVVVGSKIL